MTLTLYPENIEDLSPEMGEEIDDYVNRISEACKGWGTDELRLIKALAYRTPEERVKVSIKYKETHEKDLKKVMKKECGGDFGTALQFLAVPSNIAECDMIVKACKGMGVNELLLYSIICGRTNSEMHLLKKTFFDENDGKDLGQYLDEELGGDFEKLIFHCMQGMEEDFDEDYHNDDLVQEDVATLYAMGEGKWGTDEAGLFKILCTRPSEHLKKVNSVYAETHDVTLFKVMDSELGGHVRDATLFLLGMKIKPYETICNLIKKACKGIGTNEILLTCTIIRYQICLKQVMETYTEVFGDTLQALIKSELGGDYERLLVEICDAAASM